MFKVIIQITFNDSQRLEQVVSQEQAAHKQVIPQLNPNIILCVFLNY